MANAYKDENDVSTLIASSNVDGQTPVRLFADPVTHRLLVDGTGGTGSITVTDGSTTVTSVTTIDFTSGATVTNGGGGQANIAITGGGGGTQAYEGPLTITGATTATVHYVPIWITVNGITYVSGYGWTRSGQTVTFDGDITGATIINFHNGTAIPSGSTTYEVPSGTVNGSNTLFTFATTPVVIVIDGIAYEKTSSDGTVNWTGTTSVTVTIAPNFDIFGFDNSDSSYQSATGTVNGSNTSFSFSIAPNVIVVDGITLNKVASDSTVNWTGTTAITLTIAPLFDIFAFGGLADFQTPTGTVNGSNTSFTYSAAPNVIVVDGVEKRKTSADGTSNWSGTTSVTLTIAPNFNIFTP